MRTIAHFTRRQLELGRERMLGVLLASFGGELAPGLDMAEATDRIVALTTPEIYRTLVTERGWTPEKFEEWLGDLLVDQLLASR